MERLETGLGDIRMETPLVAVSGIYGPDYERVIESKEYVGAVVTKSVTMNPRPGNLGLRIVERTGGLLNAIGLQNAGIKAFLKEEVPKLRAIEAPIIASVAGSTIDEYVTCSSALAARDEILGIELNVSCPNADMVGIEFGTDEHMLEQLVAKVSSVVNHKTLIVKLTPNVTDIAGMARAAINGGANAISLINTLHGMAIDITTRKPLLGNRVGGVSGIVIHPVAVYMIRQCYISYCRQASIPIIGIGGVTNADEALEFMLAGATCVGIGTAVFRDERVQPDCSIFKSVALGMIEHLERRHEASIRQLIGKAAPEQLLDYSEIGEFLNIPEESARSLCRQGVMPGCANGGRWEIGPDELKELEDWYAKLSGQQWADLVADGNVDPIAVVVNLGDNVSRGKVQSALRQWQKAGVADIWKESVRPNGTFAAELRLHLNDEVGKRTGVSLGPNIGDSTGYRESARRVKERISVARQGISELAAVTTLLSVSPKGLLRIKTRDSLEELPQIEREVVRFVLASYAERLSNEIGRR